MNILKRFVHSEVAIGNFKFKKDVIASLSAETGITVSVLKAYSFGSKQCLSKNVLILEKATHGFCSRQVLRPDLYPRNLHEITYGTYHCSLAEYVLDQVDSGIFVRKTDVYRHLAQQVGVKTMTIETWANNQTYTMRGRYVLALEKASDGMVARNTLRPDLYPKNLESITYTDKTIKEPKKRILSPHERMRRVEDFIELYEKKEIAEIAEKNLKLPNGFEVSSETIVSKLNKKWS